MVQEIRYRSYNQGCLGGRYIIDISSERIYRLYNGSLSCTQSLTESSRQHIWYRRTRSVHTFCDNISSIFFNRYNICSMILETIIGMCKRWRAVTIQDVAIDSQVLLSGKPKVRIAESILHLFILNDSHRFMDSKSMLYNCLLCYCKHIKIFSVCIF